MGDNNLLTAVDGTDAVATSVNQYKTALVGNLVPRDANGIPQDLGGDLGESGKRFDDAHIRKAHISIGHLAVGMIIDHHTYNGVAPIPAGWFPCNGQIINETNYNAIHGAGKWAADIGTSVLNGKYSPNLVSKYTVGVTSTTADGSAAIPSVGNASHSFAVGNHFHKWYDHINGGTDKSFDSAGNALDLVLQPAHVGFAQVNGDLSGSMAGIDDAWTSNAGSHSVNVQPESIQTLKIIRII